jgi:hypothetical protein
MHRLILAFDRWMVRRAKMMPVSNDPNCLLRLELQRAPRNLAFGGITINKGELLLGFHIWNDHLPPLPANADNLGWALLTYRLFAASLPQMADHIRQQPQFANAKILRGKTALLPLPEKDRRNPLAALGFNVKPYRSPLGKFGNFWEHFYLYWLIWAFNPGSIKGKSLFDVSLTELWVPTSDFLARYAGK